MQDYYSIELYYLKLNLSMQVYFNLIFNKGDPKKQDFPFTKRILVDLNDNSRIQVQMKPENNITCKLLKKYNDIF